MAVSDVALWKPDRPGQGAPNGCTKRAHSPDVSAHCFATSTLSGISGPFKNIVLCVHAFVFVCARFIRARVSSDEIAMAVLRVGRGPKALCAVAAGAVSSCVGS